MPSLPWIFSVFYDPLISCLGLLLSREHGPRGFFFFFLTSAVGHGLSLSIKPLCNIHSRLEC